jgi:phosphoglycerate kinase
MPMGKKSVADVDVAGKRVLVRVDFNVPLDDAGQITDDSRIRAALPTIQLLIQRGARVILVTHLGRPKGIDPRWRLDAVAARLGELLGRPVTKLDDTIGPAVRQAVEKLAPGEVVLLENVRFYPEEEKNDPAFARELASLADLYVNDAFGTAHRAHASTEGVAHYLPAVAGLLMQREIEALGRALSHPERPFVALLGGKKVHDKIGVIRNLLNKVDTLLIGGGMAYTFLKAQGREIGKSLLDAESLDVARETLEQAAARGVRLELPEDVVVAQEFREDAPHKVVPVDAIPPDWMGMDIGPATVEKFSEILRGARTVLWNGPVGVFEMPAFAAGTRAMAGVLAEVTAAGGTTIIGGGDTAAAVESLGYGDKMTHLSTGGGASLEFLEGKELPGIAALQDR